MLDLLWSPALRDDQAVARLLTLLVPAPLLQQDEFLELHLRHLNLSVLAVGRQTSDGSL